MIKNKVITLKISENDSEILTSRAEKSNMNRSQYLREVAINSKINIKAIDKTFQKKLLFLLSNLTNNINQIARYCNTYKSTDLSILNQLDYISKNFKQVIDKELNK